MVRLYHNPLFGHIRKYILGASDGDIISLFVPYIQAKVLAKLLEGVENRVVIVTTWKPVDLLSNSSDLEVYPYCRERNIALYVNETLHLKVYSVGLDSAIIATGNISRHGLMPDGNYEAATTVERLTNADRLFFETIRANARLVDDSMYAELQTWIKDNRSVEPKIPELNDLISAPDRDDFLVSALPMTHSVAALVAGYARIRADRDPSDDQNISACIYHDLANYSIQMGLSNDEFRREISTKFFAHPFIQKIDGFIAPEAYFGRIKEWIQNNCTDVPVPSRRELTDNVQVLLEWFVELGDGRYVVDVPGRHSQRIRRV